MTAERNPIRHAAARVRCSGMSTTADIVATSSAQKATTAVAGDLLLTAIGLSRDCAYPDFAMIIGDSRLPFVALRLLFQKFFRLFLLPKPRMLEKYEDPFFDSVTLLRIPYTPSNVRRNTQSFTTTTPH